MVFDVEWHPKARKILRKLPPETSKRIVKKIKDAQQDPFRYLEHFEGEKVFKFRIGEFRLLVDVDFENRILRMQALDKRGRIYKR